MHIVLTGQCCRRATMSQTKAWISMNRFGKWLIRWIVGSSLSAIIMMFFSNYWPGHAICIQATVMSRTIGRFFSSFWSDGTMTEMIQKSAFELAGNHKNNQKHQHKRRSHVLIVEKVDEESPNQRQRNHSGYSNATEMNVHCFLPVLIASWSGAS